MNYMNHKDEASCAVCGEPVLMSNEHINSIGFPESLDFYVVHFGCKFPEEAEPETEDQCWVVII